MGAAVSQRPAAPLFARPLVLPPPPLPSSPPPFPPSLSPVLSMDREAAEEGKARVWGEGCFLPHPAGPHTSRVILGARLLCTHGVSVGVDVRSEC